MTRQLEKYLIGNLEKLINSECAEAARNTAESGAKISVETLAKYLKEAKRALRGELGVPEPTEHAHQVKGSEDTIPKDFVSNLIDPASGAMYLFKNQTEIAKAICRQAMGKTATEDAAQTALSKSKRVGQLSKFYRIALEQAIDKELNDKERLNEISPEQKTKVLEICRAALADKAPILQPIEAPLKLISNRLKLDLFRVVMMASKVDLIIPDLLSHVNAQSLLTSIICSMDKHPDRRTEVRLALPTEASSQAGDGCQSSLEEWMSEAGLEKSLAGTDTESFLVSVYRTDNPLAYYSHVYLYLPYNEENASPSTNVRIWAGYSLSKDDGSRDYTALIDPSISSAYGSKVRPNIFSPQNLLAKFKLPGQCVDPSK